MTANDSTSNRHSRQTNRCHLSGAELAEHLRRKNREKATSKARRSRLRNGGGL